MLNRIVLIGRLTRDPESQYTPNGIALAKFSIAVDRPTKNAETGEKVTDFFDCVAWRRTADFVTQYITKGRLVAVEGRVEIRSWVAQDGTKRKSFDVVADNVQGLDRPRDGEMGEAVPSEGGYSAEPRREYAPQAAAPGASGAAAPARRAAPAVQSAPPVDDLDETDPFADE